MAAASVISEDPYGVGTARWMPPSLHAAPWGSAKYYFGKADPADASHFTIDYETPPAAGND